MSQFHIPASIACLNIDIDNIDLNKTAIFLIINLFTGSFAWNDIL